MERTFAPDDKVQWTHVRTNGHKMNFSTREGKVVRTEGQGVLVKYRGKLTWLRASELRHLSEKSELTESWLALGEQLSQPSQPSQPSRDPSSETKSQETV